MKFSQLGAPHDETIGLPGIPSLWMLGRILNRRSMVSVDGGNQCFLFKVFCSSYLLVLMFPHRQIVPYNLDSAFGRSSHLQDGLLPSPDSHVSTSLLWQAFVCWLNSGLVLVRIERRALLSWLVRLLYGRFRGSRLSAQRMSWLENIYSTEY